MDGLTCEVTLKGRHSVIPTGILSGTRAEHATTDLIAMMPQKATKQHTHPIVQSIQNPYVKEAILQ